MYTGEGESFGCGAFGSSYTQAGDLVTVTSELIAPDPWMDGVGTWTFDLSHLTIAGDTAFAWDTENVTSLMTDPYYDPYNSSYGEHVTYPITATLYVAGVPLDDPPASVPEPASYALVAAPLLAYAIGKRALSASNLASAVSRRMNSSSTHSRISVLSAARASAR